MSYTVEEANKKLEWSLHTDAWFFEERGNKIVFLEKLRNTYNFIFPLTLPSGRYCRDIFDFHIHHAINFVKHVRKESNRATWDKAGRVVSGNLYEE